MVDIIMIDNSMNAPCDLCGKVAELRPYGPKGENICFECGMINQDQTAKKMEEVWVRNTIDHDAFIKIMTGKTN